MNRFIGVQVLKKKDDFPVQGENESPEDLPFVEGSNEVRVIRFNWEEDCKDPTNHAGLETVTQYARSHGAEYMSTTGDILPKVVYGDLLEKIEGRFKYLRRVYMGTANKKTTKPDGDEMNTTTRRNRGRAISRCRVHRYIKLTFCV